MRIYTWRSERKWNPLHWRLWIERDVPYFMHLYLVSIGPWGFWLQRRKGYSDRWPKMRWWDGEKWIERETTLPEWGTWDQPGSHQG